MRRLMNLLLVCALLLSVCLSAGKADSTSGGGADIDWETLFNAGGGGTVEERMKEVYKQVEEESELSKTMKELEKRKEQMERLQEYSSQARERAQSMVPETPRGDNGWIVILLLGILALFLVPFIAREVYHRVQGRPDRYELQRLQQLGVAYQDDREYVEYVAAWLNLKGYSDISAALRAGNHSVDIIATDPEQKRIAVLCRRSSGAVGDLVIDEAAEGMKEYKCQAAMVVTDRTYTRQAYDAARKKGIVLIQGLK